MSKALEKYRAGTRTPELSEELADDLERAEKENEIMSDTLDDMWEFFVDNNSEKLENVFCRTCIRWAKERLANI